MSLKFKKKITSRWHRYDGEGFWYSIENGYLDPNDYLIKADAKRVEEAISLLEDFETMLKDRPDYWGDVDTDPEDEDFDA